MRCTTSGPCKPGHFPVEQRNRRRIVAVEHAARPVRHPARRSPDSPPSSTWRRRRCATPLRRLPRGPATGPSSRWYPKGAEIAGAASRLVSYRAMRITDRVAARSLVRRERTSRRRPNHRLRRRPRDRRHRPRHRQRHRRHQRREDHRGRSGLDTRARRRDARRPQGQDDPAGPRQRARSRGGDDRTAIRSRRPTRATTCCASCAPTRCTASRRCSASATIRPPASSCANENARRVDRARLFVAGPVITGDTADAARAMASKVADMKPDLLKIRVDDNLGTQPQDAGAGVARDDRGGARARSSRSPCTSTGWPTRRRPCSPART